MDYVRLSQIIPPQPVHLTYCSTMCIYHPHSNCYSWSEVIEVTEVKVGGYNSKLIDLFWLLQIKSCTYRPLPVPLTYCSTMCIYHSHSNCYSWSEVIEVTEVKVGGYNYQLIDFFLIITMQKLYTPPLPVLLTYCSTMCIYHSDSNCHSWSEVKVTGCRGRKPIVTGHTLRMNVIT